jgi:hypothetical protein
LVERIKINKLLNRYHSKKVRKDEKTKENGRK